MKLLLLNLVNYSTATRALGYSLKCKLAHRRGTHHINRRQGGIMIFSQKETEITN